MSIEKLKVGNNPPEEVYVVVEVPVESEPVKYEFNKESGMVFVDRFMQSSMRYPCNYGFIPHTLSGDGDPVDVLVYTNYAIVPSAVVTVRPVGVLLTEDEKGKDEKILAVPTTKLDPFFTNVQSYRDLPEIFIRKIEHFFEHYKDLEVNKWVKISGWADADAAKNIITEAIARYNSNA
ncbi:MAG: inorganic diphosphatase [Proteobacteria bacterium]|nr:inorganic diphosphatase [Pseudomonadota bacterium]